jgi:hypothetical protein
MNGTEATDQRSIPNKRQAGGKRIITTPQMMASFLKAITINQIQAMVIKIEIRKIIVPPS